MEGRVSGEALVNLGRFPFCFPLFPKRYVLWRNQEKRKSNWQQLLSLFPPLLRPFKYLKLPCLLARWSGFFPGNFLVYSVSISGKQNYLGFYKETFFLLYLTRSYTLRLPFLFRVLYLPSSPPLHPPPPRTNAPSCFSL